ncbi:MAG: hypothetical protein WCY53_06745 [Sphaerochaetaceae bacterium]
MNKLVKAIIKEIPQALFGVHDLRSLGFRDEHVRYGLIKRAVAAGDLIIIKRGVYALAPEYRKETLNPYYAAQIINGPSYVSLETALSEHGLIPESVHAITCVANKQARDFNTSVGYFSYSRVPQKILYCGVSREVDQNGYAWMLANPVKALADYVYTHKKDWISSKDVAGSLRMEIEDIFDFKKSDFEDIFDNYTNKRVLAFLKGLYSEIFT